MKETIEIMREILKKYEGFDIPEDLHDPFYEADISDAEILCINDCLFGNGETPVFKNSGVNNTVEYLKDISGEYNLNSEYELLHHLKVQTVKAVNRFRKIIKDLKDKYDYE